MAQQPTTTTPASPASPIAGMTGGVSRCRVPRDSMMARYLDGADYVDAYEVLYPHGGRPILDSYLAVVRLTPRWFDFLMALRNRLVSLVGLKDLGLLADIDFDKPSAAYRVGDRIGVFSLLYVGDEEILLEDADKHLDVRVSVRKGQRGDNESVTVTTVVHLHNLFGRVYLAAIMPIHTRIVPAMLLRAAETHCN